MACCCPAVRVKDCRSIAGSGNPSSGSVPRAPGGGVAVGHGPGIPVRLPVGRSLSVQMVCPGAGFSGPGADPGSNARPSFRGAGCSALREQAVRQNCVRLRAASALPCIRIAFCLTGCFPRRFLLPTALSVPVCGPGAASLKNNRAPVQRVRAKTEKISTEGLEVCSKSFYLCTTPQGRSGCSGRSSHEKRRV